MFEGVLKKSSIMRAVCIAEFKVSGDPFMQTWAKGRQRCRAEGKHLV